MPNVNISKVYLLNVPLENDYKHTLYFTSLANQQAYFQSRIVKSYTDFSYQRKDHIIRIPEEYDEIYHVNYVMYQNSAYSNKWFYAFITDLKYVNDGMTEATIETDVIQTWMFDYTVKPSFVEREHVDDDTIGLHTVPEGLETGDYVVENYEQETISSSRAHLVISATYDVFEDKDAGSYINGIYNGVDYFLIGSVSGASAVNSYVDSIQYFLKSYASAGKSDAITGLFIVPDEITEYDYIQTNDLWDYMSTAGGLSYFRYKKLTSAIIDGAMAMSFPRKYITKPYTTVGGYGDTYTPSNNKLFTYPFKYLMATNNTGGEAIYQYEYFNNEDNQGVNKCPFRTEGALTPGCAIKTTPVNYKGALYNFEEGLNFPKYPICSYNTDMYINWLTQNGLNIATQIGLGLAGGIGGALTGNLVALGGGVLTTWNAISSVLQHELIPPQAEGNLNNGDINYSMGISNISFYKMSIKKEYAQIIDRFFDMYGYKVNTVKIPNKAHRSRYWYTKTIDINIDGAIPQNDLQRIKECYNNGITFWRNANEIQDYSLSNAIV